MSIMRFNYIVVNALTGQIEPLQWLLL